MAPFSDETSRFWVRFHLAELLDDLKPCFSDLDEGFFDDCGDAALFVSVDHFISHLNGAWNYGSVLSDIRQEYTHKEFEQFRSTVPNFEGRYRLLRDWDLVDFWQSREDDVCSETVSYYMRQMESIVDTYLDQDPYNPESFTPKSLAQCISQAMNNLLLAWHLRRFKLNYIANLPKEFLEEAPWSVPDSIASSFRLGDPFIDPTK